VCGVSLLFFFSSRRRHTRSLRDWSSDVCSSDLFAKWAGKRLPTEVEWEYAARGPSYFLLDDQKKIHSYPWGTPEGDKSTWIAYRSEERRVGKECRSRWSA